MILEKTIHARNRRAYPPDNAFHDAPDVVENPCACDSMPGRGVVSAAPDS